MKWARPPAPYDLQDGTTNRACLPGKHRGSQTGVGDPVSPNPPHQTFPPPPFPIHIHTDGRPPPRLPTPPLAEGDLLIGGGNRLKALPPPSPLDFPAKGPSYSGGQTRRSRRSKLHTHSPPINRTPHTGPGDHASAHKPAHTALWICEMYR